MEKKNPVRQCIGCGERKEKKELIRIVFTADQGLLIDRTGRNGGRGAYLCPDPACVEAAVKKNSFSRAFRGTVGAAAAESLKQQIGEYLSEQERERHAAG